MIILTEVTVVPFRYMSWFSIAPQVVRPSAARWEAHFKFQAHHSYTEILNNCVQLFLNAMIASKKRVFGFLLVRFLEWRNELNPPPHFVSHQFFGFKATYLGEDFFNFGNLERVWGR